MDSLARSVLDAVLVEYPVWPKQIVSLKTDKEFSRSDEMPRRLAALRRSLPGLRHDTFNDYCHRNKESVDAKELFGEHPNLVYCSSEELSAIFDEGGWEQFDETYPDTSGILKISRPGYSSDRQQALIIIGQHIHYTVGSGHYYLCDYDGATWRVTAECIAWRC